MRRKNRLNSIIKAAVIIFFSAALVSCGKYTPAHNNQNEGNTGTEQTANIIAYKDGEYSLVQRSCTRDSYKAVNFYSILNGFAADGKTDDSAALQSLLDKAAENGGGVVYVSKGLYRLENPINIPDGVTLTGDFISPRSASGTADCTVFIVAETEQTLSSPLFTLGDGSGLNEITIYYESQTYGSIKSYPYTVKHATGKTALIENIALINSVNGIDLASGTAEEVTVSGICMTALKNGINAELCSGKLEITNIYEDPSVWFNSELDTLSSEADASALSEYIRMNLSALKIGSSGDAYIDGIQINVCRYGLTVDIPYTSENTPLFSDMIINDATGAALVLGSAPSYGIAFADCSFRTDDSFGSHDAEIKNTFVSPAVFNSCSFRGNPTYSVYSEGSSKLSFVGCDFVSWQNAAIYSTDSILTASGGGFYAKNTLAEFPKLTVGIFALNIMNAQYAEDGGFIYVASTVNEYSAEKITDTWFEDLTSEFTIGGKIYKASDYGVTSAASDNTLFLQAVIDDAYKSGGGTVFLDSGHFFFTGKITLLNGVRLQGAGSGKTELKFSHPTDADVFITLNGQNKLEGFALSYVGTEDAEAAAAAPVRAIYSESKNISIKDVTFSRVHYAMWFSGASNITAEKITGCAITGGIYAEKCDFLHLSDISFLRTDLTDDEIAYQHEKFVAVTIRSCTGTLCENMTSENGDYLLYLNSEQVDIVPDEPSAAVKGLFARNTYAAFAVNQYDFAAVVNVSAVPEIYNKNAYFATTFAGNYGRLCVYNIIGRGNVTGNVYLRGGTVSVQSSVFGTAGTSVVRNDGATAEVIGCMFLDNSCDYHAETNGGSTALIANIVSTSADFDGTNSKYLRKYTDTDAACTDEFNLRPAE